MSQTLLRKQRWLHARLSEGKEEGEDGFTLIELLIVLLIIGILLGIAIPAYLSVVGTASTKTAQTNIQTAITAVDAVATANGDVLPPTNAGNSGLIVALQNQGDNITWLNATAAKINTNEVSVYDGSSGEYVVFAAAGANNRCIYGSVVYNSGATGAPSSGTTVIPGTYYSSGAAPTGGCVAGTGITGWKTSL